MKWASDRELVVHPWTYRKVFLSSLFPFMLLVFFQEQSELSYGFDSLQEETNYFLCCLRLDGFFTEFPDVTREAISAYERSISSYCSASTSLCPYTSSDTNGEKDDDEVSRIDDGLDIFVYIVVPIVAFGLLVFVLRQQWMSSSTQGNQGKDEDHLLSSEGANQIPYGEM